MVDFDFKQAKISVDLSENNIASVILNDIFEQARFCKTVETITQVFSTFSFNF